MKTLIFSFFLLIIIVIIIKIINFKEHYNDNDDNVVFNTHQKMILKKNLFINYKPDDISNLNIKDIDLEKNNLIVNRSKSFDKAALNITNKLCFGDYCFSGEMFEKITGKSDNPEDSVYLPAFYDTDKPEKEDKIVDYNYDDLKNVPRSMCISKSNVFKINNTPEKNRYYFSVNNWDDSYLRNIQGKEVQSMINSFFKVTIKYIYVYKKVDKKIFLGIGKDDGMIYEYSSNENNTDYWHKKYNSKQMIKFTEILYFNEKIYGLSENGIVYSKALEDDIPFESVTQRKKDIKNIVINNTYILGIKNNNVFYCKYNDDLTWKPLFHHYLNMYQYKKIALTNSHLYLLDTNLILYELDTNEINSNNYNFETINNEIDELKKKFTYIVDFQQYQKELPSKFNEYLKSKVFETDISNILSTQTYIYMINSDPIEAFKHDSKNDSKKKINLNSSYSNTAPQTCDDENIYFISGDIIKDNLNNNLSREQLYGWNSKDLNDKDTSKKTTKVGVQTTKTDNDNDNRIYENIIQCSKKRFKGEISENWVLLDLNKIQNIYGLVFQKSPNYYVTSCTFYYINEKKTPSLSSILSYNKGIGYLDETDFVKYNLIFTNDSNNNFIKVFDSSSNSDIKKLFFKNKLKTRYVLLKNIILHDIKNNEIDLQVLDLRFDVLVEEELDCINGDHIDMIVGKKGIRLYSSTEDNINDDYITPYQIDTLNSNNNYTNQFFFKKKDYCSNNKLKNISENKDFLERKYKKPYNSDGIRANDNGKCREKTNFRKIYAFDEKGRKCGLRADRTINEKSNETNALFDCSGKADNIIMEDENNKKLLFTMIDEKKCGLEWDSTINDSIRNAKWDCKGNGSDIKLENEQLNTKDNCWLTFDKKDSNQINAIWDCKFGKGVDVKIEQQDYIEPSNKCETISDDKKCFNTPHCKFNYDNNTCDIRKCNEYSCNPKSCNSEKSLGKCTYDGLTDQCIENNENDKNFFINKNKYKISQDKIPTNIPDIMDINKDKFSNVAYNQPYFNFILEPAKDNNGELEKSDTYFHGHIHKH